MIGSYGCRCAKGFVNISDVCQMEPADTLDIKDDWWLIEGFEGHGADLGASSATTLDTCVESCIGQNICVGVNFNRNTKKCLLKGTQENIYLNSTENVVYLTPTRRKITIDSFRDISRLPYFKTYSRPATCSVVEGVKQCTCNSGFSKNTTSDLCIDDDECEQATSKGISLCNTDYECFNTPGSFVCDQNECRTGTHNCGMNMNCLNTPGRWTCQCKPGYQIDGNTNVSPSFAYGCIGLVIKNNS